MEKAAPPDGKRRLRPGGKPAKAKLKPPLRHGLTRLTAAPVRLSQQQAVLNRQPAPVTAAKLPPYTQQAALRPLVNPCLLVSPRRQQPTFKVPKALKLP